LIGLKCYGKATRKILRVNFSRRIRCGPLQAQRCIMLGIIVLERVDKSMATRCRKERLSAGGYAVANGVNGRKPQILHIDGVKGGKS